MPEASRTVSEIVLLQGKFGPQNAQKCNEFKGFQVFGQISLDVRVGPASPAGRPQPASAGRRSWELVLALTPPCASFVYSKKKGFTSHSRTKAHCELDVWGLDREEGAAELATC